MRGRQANERICTVQAPVRVACSELDSPASAKELFALLPTIEPGGENI